MPVFVVLVVLIVVAAVWLLSGRDRGDLPARVAGFAVRRLPSHRREWGRAMLAELGHIDGPGARRRFAAGVVWVGLFPPPERRARVALVAGAGLAGAATGSLAAARAVPSLWLFVTVLGGLLGGYATLAAARHPRPARTAPERVVAGVALAGVAAAVAVVVAIAAVHPAATADDAHVLTVVFALVLTAYLVVALAPPRGGADTPAVLWWGLGGAVAAAVAWTARGLTGGVAPLVPPVAAAVVLFVAVGAALRADDRAAGVRAGWLAVVLAAPLHFALGLGVVLGQGRFALGTAYDVAAFPHSGYPDVASYVLGDAIGGNLIAGLVLTPLLLGGLALLGAAAGPRLIPAPGGFRRG
ncbi:hypothetical protein ACPPVO_20335 [Dactylosporangium sp. McL0621]|uniref:hypothetical protein n=1 Tax=Dactylosporangium sp. McL0621 TaxID=3415678 RepID=UPI003CE8D466